MKQLLDVATFQPVEVERYLDPNRQGGHDFHPVFGYTLGPRRSADGVEGAICEYDFEPGGCRKIIHYADRPCRINTYGNSYTLCAQVSDGETWQEVLAAHILEPIRNFGVGGFGVYQAYRRAMEVENTDLAAEYLILNIFEDDHLRSLDVMRWIRVSWMLRDVPRGETEGAYPISWFPWVHVRYDLAKGTFVELPGLCREANDLRKLADRDFVDAVFKDDPVVHLYTLTEGGEAPVGELEKLAEAFGMRVDLRDPATRTEEARKLYNAYGFRATMYIVEKLDEWARVQGKKLMILLSYDVLRTSVFLEKGDRFDCEFLNFLESSGVPYVDGMEKAAEEYALFKGSVEEYINRMYVVRSGQNVFGHYSPLGNFWFAFAIKEEIANWLDPKPPAYA